MNRRQYTTEFKKDAAYQIIIEGVAVQELLDRLGVPTPSYIVGKQSTLKSWRRTILPQHRALKRWPLRLPIFARSWRSPSG